MHSFVSPTFAQRFHVALAYMDTILSVATPLGVSMDADLVYRGCPSRGHGVIGRIDSIEYE